MCRTWPWDVFGMFTPEFFKQCFVFRLTAESSKHVCCSPRSDCFTNVWQFLLGDGFATVMRLSWVHQIGTRALVLGPPSWDSYVHWVFSGPHSPFLVLCCFCVCCCFLFFVFCFVFVYVFVVCFCFCFWFWFCFCFLLADAPAIRDSPM